MTTLDPSNNAAGNAVTGNFTLQAALPDGKTFTVSGYLYDQEPVESINGRIDLLHSVVDRVRTRAELPQLEVKLDQAKQRLTDIKLHYGVILTKKDKGEKLSTQEKQALEVMDINVNKHAEDAVKGEAAIAKAKAELGMI